MKKFRLLVLIGLILCFIGEYTLSAQDKYKKQDTKELVKELLKSQKYTLTVNRALPASGRAINLTSSYQIEIKGDSIVSYLPYYGRAYTVPYGGGDGLRFESVLTDCILSFDKKGKANIQFKAITKEDRFTFNVQVFENGKASINILPVNRQQISFNGDLILSERK